jgi:hypothetical protein
VERRLSDIDGLRVCVDRPDHCCANVAIVRAGQNGAYGLRCEECNSDRGELPAMAVSFLKDAVRVFGTPSAPLFLSGAITRKATAMNRNDLFPSKYFKAADLGGKAIDLVIRSATLEMMKNMQGGNESKLVLSFVNQSKALVVNRTNYDAIADLYGDETEDWGGKRIQLYPTKASIGGKSVDAVRVRAPLSDALNDSINI